MILMNLREFVGTALPPSTCLNGRYVLGHVLGSGGFSITYIALDTHFQTTVAVKEFYLKQICTRRQGMTISVASKDQEIFEDSRRFFLNEAKILAMLSENSAGVVKVVDSFAEKNTAYIVMEYLEGETLKNRIKKGTLKYYEMMELMDPICNVLMKVHQLKILHLDVSPDNIMILYDGRAKLFDFGGAKAIGTKDSYGQIIYKKGYTPLEQRTVNGRVGKWTDVYALAATMYFCLIGRKPTDVWEREAGEELRAPSEYGTDIPREAEIALMKALEFDPSDRFQSVEDFWNAL